MDEKDVVIGYGNSARFHLDGKYENELLLLYPVEVKTELQRQYISKELIEFSFEKAKTLGFKAIIMEGNPMNYLSRGFVTSADYGVTAQESVGLFAPGGLIAKELVSGALVGIHGQIGYQDYKSLQ